jgi:virulence-associated protein VagC
MTITQVIQTSDGQVVRLPAEFQFSQTEVSIRKNGEAVILEPVRNGTWPEGFFDQIRIADPHFRRPDQGVVPPAPDMGF